MDTTTPANIRVYRVESGDTLFGIAKKHQTTIEELRRLNGDRLETLYLGQEIYLPDPSVHRVQEGETFYEIITRHGLDAETFKKYNQLDSYQLHIGQVLRIPPPTPALPPTPRQGRVHTVETGDSLFNLAQKYGVTVNDIRRANQLDANLLNIGQQLIIPSPENTQQALQAHFVGQEDTIHTIAEKHKVTPDALQAFNQLEATAQLSAGQLLYIPSSDYQPTEQVRWESHISLPDDQRLREIEQNRAEYFKIERQYGVRIFKEGLRGGIGEGEVNDTEDLQKVKQRLEQLQIPVSSDDPAAITAGIRAFQERFKVDWWSRHPVWADTQPPFEAGKLRPNDLTYRLLREYTHYRLQFRDHKDQHQEARFTNFATSPMSVYPYGVAYTGTARYVFKDSYFHQLGMSKILSEAMAYISGNQSNFDALNTYDRAVFSFGFVQFAGQSAQGMLPKLLAFIKKENPTLFEDTFGRFGVEVEYSEPQPFVFRPARVVVIDPGAAQGLTVLRGREAEEHLRITKLLYGVFIRAGHHPEIAQLQLRAAVHFYVRPVLGSRISLDIGHRRELGSELIRDVIRSSAGLAALIDLTIHHGLSQALLMIEEAIEAVAEQHGLSTVWQVRNIDERKILRYLRRRHTHPFIKQRMQRILDLATEEQQKPMDQQLFSFLKRY